MKHIAVNGKRLVVDGNSMVFRKEITRYIEIGDCIVVRLIIEGQGDNEKNIYGVRDGRIAWRVQDMLEYNKEFEPFLPDAYTGIDIYEKDENLIIATTGYGWRLAVSPENGKIIGVDGWTK